MLVDTKDCDNEEGALLQVRQFDAHSVTVTQFKVSLFMLLLLIGTVLFILLFIAITFCSP